MNYIINIMDYIRKSGEKSMPDISNERKIQIENIVNNILTSEHMHSSAVIDIVPLVKKHEFLVQTADLPIDTTGYLVVNDEESIDGHEDCHRLIVVNNKFKNKDKEENVVLKKSRFITAHEFGHFVLHKKPNEPLYAHRDSDKRDTLIELEADYFARSILMPSKPFLKINKIIDEIIGIDGIESEEEMYDFKISFLSKFFKVTQDKAKKRMGDVEVLSSIRV